MKFSQLCLCGILASASASAWAVPFSFTNITNNGSNNVASQLSVDVTDNLGSASFVFTNIGALGSNVTEIYFDNAVAGLGGPITGFLSLVNGVGVNFSTAFSLNPGNLPGGGSITPTFTSDWGVDSANGNGNGINPGETLTINLTTNASAIDALLNGDLRIGLHVRSIEGYELSNQRPGFSDSFITNPPREVPDATSTLALLALGLGSLGLIARRRKA